jgi:glycine C-acetyltransferase
MYGRLKEELIRTLQGIREAGVSKQERVLSGPQGVEVVVEGRRVLNFCANNYLGLSGDPRVVEAARATIAEWGYGLSSGRVLCGTQEIHRRLETEVARFLRTEDAILYSSCLDANAGIFEPLLGAQDAILTDELNHASIIDGIRLCKAQRFIYRHADMESLEAKLKEASGARFRLIATDGVFSMDGDLAPLDRICALAEKHDALVMVDDSHATGFVGRTGRGTAEQFGVEDRVDIVTTTFGKALGGASGGCTASHREVVEVLRQRSRSYVFTNTLAPAVVGGTLAVLALLSSTTALRDRLEANAKRFREGMTAAGFELKPGSHPIVPVMLHDSHLAQAMARDLFEEGIYVVAFTYPIVAKGQERIRAQISAAHEPSHIDRAVEAFTKVGSRLGVIG